MHSKLCRQDWAKPVPIRHQNKDFEFSNKVGQVIRVFNMVTPAKTTCSVWDLRLGF